MRPDSLHRWFASVSAIKGVGPALHVKLRQLFGRVQHREPCLRDLAYHLPFDVIDRRFEPKLTEVHEPVVGTITVTIDEHQPPPRGRSNVPYRIRCSNLTGFITLIYFHVKGDYLKRQLPLGTQKVVSGRLEPTGRGLQMAHPDAVVSVNERESVARLEPIYPLTEGLGNKQMRKLIGHALGQLTPLPEWQDAAFYAQQNWPSHLDAVRRIHHPESRDDISTDAPAMRRLIYDELLASQLTLALIREKLRQPKTAFVAPPGRLRQQLQARLPFSLTGGQQQVLQEIDADMASGKRMLRLLQGDVGSGKTLVAVAAMLNVIEADGQAALMAPTELLARQHLATIRPLLEPLGIRVALLSGKVDASARQSVLAGLADGSVQLVIGTHALFQESVRYRNLGMAVIDEQHRFGVNQRLALADKGEGTHILLMTATPIPRSLTMTAFGDMDSSRLMEKPKGRKPITTRILPMERREEVLEGLRRAIQEGGKAYWICPLVEATEDALADADVAAVTLRQKEFAAWFGRPVGLVHGRMPPDEREAAMAAFASGETPLLVATTVVEVGVDVPDATIIVIEQAEQFGLSQLHQLRGRVGRGDKPSSCLLLYGSKLGEIGKKRLTVMRESEDGFFLAEEDLRLRGGGDVLGTKQSGMPQFHFADVMRDFDLLKIARDDAKLIVQQNLALEGPRGEALRTLLYLFEQDSKLRFLRSG